MTAAAIVTAWVLLLGAIFAHELGLLRLLRERWQAAEPGKKLRDRLKAL